MIFSQYLIGLRFEQKLSQEKLAEQLGTTVEQIAAWEAGKSVPTAQECSALAQALGVTPERMAAVIETQQPEKADKPGLKRFLTKKVVTVASACLAGALVVGLAVTVSLALNANVPVDAGVDSSQVSLPEEPSSQEIAASNSTSSDSQSGAEQSSLGTASSRQGTTGINGSSKPQACTHVYSKETVMPTCKARGYTTHTCSKCGYSYTDAYTTPQHFYGKYLCDFCGKPDPANAYYSMSAWVLSNTESEGGATSRRLTYSEGDVSYQLVCVESMSSVIFSGDNRASNEGISVMFTKDGSCQLSYSSRFGNGSATLSKASLSSSMQLKLNNFTYKSGMGPDDCTEEAFKADFARAADDLMNTVQNKFLTPKMELTLKQLGFTAYS